jgi:hypothetical protein
MSVVETRRGDNAVISGQAVDSNGAPINVTGYTFTFTARLDRDDPDPAPIVKTSPTGVVIVDAVNGKIEVRLAPSDTSALTADTLYVFDVQLVDGSGNKRTIDDGYLVVLEDVTRS